MNKPTPKKIAKDIDKILKGASIAYRETLVTSLTDYIIQLIQKRK